MVVQRFGGAHTEQKLEKLSAYLKAFTTALKNQHFTLAYLDAFAGTGEIELTEKLTLPDSGADREAFVKGSVQRALAIEPPFDSYTFVELKPKKAAALQQKIQAEYPTRNANVLVGDANDKIKEVVKNTDWKKTRAVVFLDPFGSQVSWKTLELLASTKAVDVWYLFPSGLSVLRQIGRDGKIDPEHRKSVDRILGTKDWDRVLVQTTPTPNLFGETDEQLNYRANAQEITKYMSDRMGKIFAGGVNPNTLPLGSRNVHMYSLMFACANPKEVASKLAHRLATAVLRSARNKRS